jgi:hypothetical protein
LAVTVVSPRRQRARSAEKDESDERRTIHLRGLSRGLSAGPQLPVPGTVCLPRPLQSPRPNRSSSYC